MMDKAYTASCNDSSFPSILPLMQFLLLYPADLQLLLHPWDLQLRDVLYC
jgi:hypothetical protein